MSKQILCRAIIRKLERICKDKLRECNKKHHPNSEVIRRYNPRDTISVVYFRCNDCGTVYAKEATEKDKKLSWYELQAKAIMELRDDNYKK